MNIPTFKWLLAELPVWVSSGILDQPSADRIRAKYAAQLKSYDRTSSVSMPIAIIVILLLAAAWIALDQLSWGVLPTWVRVSLALTPWLLASAALVWTRASAAPLAKALDVRESSALLQAIASWVMLYLFSSIAGMDIAADEVDLLTAWLVMQVPLLLLTRSTVMMFAILFVCVANYRFLEFNLPVFWTLLLAWSAYAYFQLRLLREEMPRIAVICLWAIAANLSISVVLELLVGSGGDELGGAWERFENFPETRALPTLIILAFYFAALAGAGRMYLTSFARPFAHRLSSRPFEVVGGAGIFFCLWIYQSILSSGSHGTHHLAEMGRMLVIFQDLSASGLVLLVLSIAGWAAVAFLQYRRADFRLAPFLLAPVLMVLCQLLANFHLPLMILSWLLLAYIVFGIAVWMIGAGTITGRYIVVDAGVMALVVMLGVVMGSIVGVDDGEQAYVLFAIAILMLMAHFAYFRKKIVSAKLAE